jgi:hypothetical protein
MEQRVVAADVRLTAGKVLLDQSMLAGEPVSHRSRVTPVSWSCRLVAGSGRAGHCGTGSAFVPQIALLIAAATGNRRVFASGHDLEVIPVTLGVSSWKVSRQRLRPASCSSLPDLTDLNEVKALSACKAGQATKASPYEMVPRS